MNQNFGPWATTMHSSSAAALSAFWKERMGRLPAVVQAPARCSARTASVLWLVAALICSLPTLHGAESQAENEAAANSQTERAGRIYVNGWLRHTPEGATEPEDLRGIFSIDPQTGDWKRLLEFGHGARVSPDGETLIFSRDEETWNCDAKEAAGPGRVAGVSGNTSWTADGRHFIVSSGKIIEEEQKEFWRNQTWKISADGLVRTELAIPSTDAVEDCSPAGDLLVTCSDRHPPHASGYQLYVMRSDGSEQRRLTHDGLNCYARFSPDGKRIAYVHQDGSGNSLRVVNVDGSGDQTILRENGYSNSSRAAVWSPDGKRLAVVRFDWQVSGENGERVISDPADANYRIELMEADGGNPSSLELKNARIVWLGSPEWR